MIFKALTAKATRQQGDGSPVGTPPAAERYRDVLLVVLTLTTGAPPADIRPTPAAWRCAGSRRTPGAAPASWSPPTGAALGTLAALNAPGWVPAAVLIPIAVVLTGSLWRRP